MKTTILVRNFEFCCHIGILDHEYTSPQRIQVSAEITLKTNDPVTNLQDSLCYMQIQEFIRDCTQTHVALVEDLAATIVRHYMNDPRVESATIDIFKLAVAPDTQGVGVRVTDKKS